MLHHLGVTNVDKATSGDGEGARNIDRLKGRVPPAQRLQGIVTVGMAYEGLDCPEITPIACLTQVRSAEWLEQMLARDPRDYSAGRDQNRRPMLGVARIRAAAPTLYANFQRYPRLRHLWQSRPRLV